MNRSVHNNKLRAAKRRIFDSLRSDGYQTEGIKHKHIIAEFLNRNDLQRPVEVNWQDYIIALYDANELPGIVIRKRVHNPRKQKIKRTRGVHAKKEKDERRQEYEDYLKSPEWRLFRRSALDHFGNRCGLCDADGTMDLHHKTYKNFMKETFADVIPLCRKCHKRHHNR